MAKKYTTLALLAFIPALALTSCGSSSSGSHDSASKKVGDATCQNYVDALNDYGSDSSKDLMNKLNEDAGIDPNNATLSEFLTYQLMDYCGIDVQTFLQGGDIKIDDGSKKLADFTFVVPTPEATH